MESSLVQVTDDHCTTREPAYSEPMTSRLYYTDSYATTFDGRITELSADGQRVYLDQTAFYPTSGGQPFDVGSLGGARVADVIDEDDRVAHVLAAPLSSHAIGDTVRG